MAIYFRFIQSRKSTNQDPKSSLNSSNGLKCSRLFARIENKNVRSSKIRLKSSTQIAGGLKCDPQSYILYASDPNVVQQGRRNSGPWREGKPKHTLIVNLCPQLLPWSNSRNCMNCVQRPGHLHAKETGTMSREIKPLKIRLIDTYSGKK